MGNKGSTGDASYQPGGDDDAFGEYDDAFRRGPAFSEGYSLAPRRRPAAAYAEAPPDMQGKTSFLVRAEHRSDMHGGDEDWDPRCVGEKKERTCHVGGRGGRAEESRVQDQGTDLLFVDRTRWGRCVARTRMRNHPAL